jgi:NAD(P)-dependent dehydrogenase (short-subunit alcohol dehydrogenase family)
MTRAPGVLITGGASGIGRAAVRCFLDRGWSVVAADYNDEACSLLLDDFAADRDAGLLDAVRTDVAQEADVAAAVQRTVQRCERIDCVINNAGVGGAFGPLTVTEVEDWDYSFNVMVRGVFLGIKHAASAMQADGQGGVIINTASAAGEIGGIGPHAYSAAKAAVISLTRTAAIELAESRIRVNAVSPGPVITPLFGGEEMVAEGTDFRAALPWPDVGRPEDIAAVMAFLASSEARYMTGENVKVDGGISAAGPRLKTTATLPVAGVNRGTTGERAIVRRRLGTE